MKPVGTVAGHLLLRCPRKQAVHGGLCRFFIRLPTTKSDFLRLLLVLLGIVYVAVEKLLIESRYNLDELVTVSIHICMVGKECSDIDICMYLFKQLMMISSVHIFIS